MAKRKTGTKQTLKIMKEVINNGGRKQQPQQVKLLEKDVHLEQNDFTKHPSIKHLFKEFVIQATALEHHYQINKKHLIRTLAVNTENELRKLGLEDLISHISEAIVYLLREARLKWSAEYVRECLDSHYKSEFRRTNALARKRHPGVPEDTGKTVEELEASLNRKPIVGKYNVKCEIELGEGFLYATPVNKKGEGEMFDCPSMPVIVHVNAAEQTATVELDIEAHKLLIDEANKWVKTITKAKTKSNA